MRMEKSMVIKASPEKVWEMLALDRMPEWMEGWKSGKYTSEAHNPEDKYRVGATAHIIGPEEFNAEITESRKREDAISWESAKDVLYYYIYLEIRR